MSAEAGFGNDSVLDDEGCDGEGSTIVPGSVTPVLTSSPAMELVSKVGILDENISLGRLKYWLREKGRIMTSRRTTYEEMVAVIEGIQKERVKEKIISARDLIATLQIRGEMNGASEWITVLSEFCTSQKNVREGGSPNHMPSQAAPEQLADANLVLLRATLEHPTAVDKAISPDTTEPSF